MKYIRTTGWEDGLADLTQTLVRELSAGKKVLWIISGGSNIPASVQVMQNISAKLSRNLSIMLGDERFGPYGHPDSNCTQLANAGFDCENARTFKVLQPNMNLSDTLARYRKKVKSEFTKNDIIIAQLGMGEDGHIAGILPGSQASRESKQLVAAYSSKPYTRLTLTFPALKQIDIAYVFAFGDNKIKALQTLKTKRTDLEQQPAQVLKQIKNSYVYNDQVG